QRLSFGPSRAAADAFRAALDAAARNNPRAGALAARAGAAVYEIQVLQAPHNAETVALSRRNTNVRSLALSLGRKRMVTAECDDQLGVLEQALAGHPSGATR